jgi:hypothetical protein
VIYLLSLLVISWIAGALLNQTLAGELSNITMHHGEHSHLALWQKVSGVALLALLGWHMVLKLKKEEKSCCGS